MLKETWFLIDSCALQVPSWMGVCLSAVLIEMIKYRYLSYDSLLKRTWVHRGALQVLYRMGFFFYMLIGMIKKEVIV